ncbi:hypothetical protein BDW22DRAFT_1431724 [Trametopsis cervina]|nr:hypothetical protein BDW22DRAFT_1431724 [Trametopsis cervina]
MALDDLLYFDEDAYAQKISRPHYPDSTLADNIHRKRRELASSGFSIGAGVALAPLTSGVSLASSAYGCRTLDIAHQKLALLEYEWRRRGYLPLRQHIGRDTILPMTLSGVVSVATLGFDMGLGAAGANAVSQAGVYGLGQVMHDAYHGYAANAAGSHFVHGFGKGFEEVAHHTISGSNFPANGAPLPPYTAIGEAVGVEAARGGVHLGMHQAAHTGQEYWARRW